MGLFSSGMFEIFMNFEEAYLVLMAVSFPVPDRETNTAIFFMMGSSFSSSYLL